MEETALQIYTKYFKEGMKELCLEITKLNKELEKYKSIEEELGCPLKVRCEVMPNSYIYTFGIKMNNQEVITKRKVITISKDGIYVLCNTINGEKREMMLSWKAYQKSWWLKEDRGE